MQEYYLKEFEITKDKVESLIKDTYYEIMDLMSSEELSSEQSSALYNALEGNLNGALGIASLISSLLGTNYELKQDPKTGEVSYEKLDPTDPDIIYTKLNELIQEINNVLRRNKNYQ